MNFDQKLFQLRSFLTYWLDAVDEHSLHSPFLFDFYTNVLKAKAETSAYNDLLALKKKFSKDRRILSVNDYGAGSVKLKSPERRISDIVSLSTTPEKYAMLYARIISHYRYKNVIELGTSVGINTLYLGNASERTNVTTFEGSAEIAGVARKLFLDHHANNIQLIEGNIDRTLLPYLSSIENFDFALMDANHRYEATLRYFDLLLKKVHDFSVIIMDDIHYSAEMEQAWHAIKTHQQVFTTIDLYRCGLIFFNPSLTRQNVVLEF